VGLAIGEEKTEEEEEEGGDEVRSVEVEREGKLNPQLAVEIFARSSKEDVEGEAAGGREVVEILETLPPVTVPVPPVPVPPSLPGLRKVEVFRFVVRFIPFNLLPMSLE
jgi:hypothetical protein